VYKKKDILLCIKKKDIILCIKKKTSYCIYTVYKQHNDVYKKKNKKKKKKHDIVYKRKKGFLFL
jgi:hypothetical protein